MIFAKEMYANQEQNDREKNDGEMQITKKVRHGAVEVDMLLDFENVMFIIIKRVTTIIPLFHSLWPSIMSRVTLLHRFSFLHSLRTIVNSQNRNMPLEMHSFFPAFLFSLCFSIETSYNYE